MVRKKSRKVTPRVKASTQSEHKASNRNSSSRTRNTKRSVKPGGRPRKEIDLDQLQKLCSIQCTDEEIAEFFACSTDTIRNRKQTDEAFLKAYKKGHAEGKISIRRMQYIRAKKSVTMQIWLGKQYLGQGDKSLTQQISAEEMAQEIQAFLRRANAATDPEFK